MGCVVIAVVFPWLVGWRKDSGAGETRRRGRGVGGTCVSVWGRGITEGGRRRPRSGKGEGCAVRELAGDCRRIPSFLLSLLFLLFFLRLSLPAMSSQSGNPISPPPGSANSANAGGVRRHHTISASSRTARPTSKIALNELDDPQAEQLWNDDEPVDQDWVGGIGAVGEKSSLHRQASLPTRYHRGESVLHVQSPPSSVPYRMCSKHTRVLRVLIELPSVRWPGG